MSFHTELFEEFSTHRVPETTGPERVLSRFVGFSFLKEGCCEIVVSNGKF